MGRIIEKMCRGCGSSLTGIKHKHLCPPCRTERRAKHNRRKNFSGSDYRRRAKLFGVDYEYVEPAKVYQRDGWKCGICNKKINPKLKYPHTKSASLDHITPLSRGGTHTYTNCQAAHLECNTKKGNRGAHQLRLFG